LVAVAVPIFNAVTKNAKNRTCAANARILSSQINTIVMNEIGGGDGESAAVSTVSLSEETTIDELLAGGSTDKVTSYLQGNVLPVCPVNSANTYNVDETGKVTCSGAQEDGKHGL
ncbi:MAG: hypothetical protein GX848_02865, partial [Clostridiales bacterium]|nr:hypothetical protein [Clostridiales bacterium]